MNEELFEYGKVIKADNGMAEVLLAESGACHSCGAKMFCRPGEENKDKILNVIDYRGVKVGDTVTISVKGKNIVKIASLLYGLPLVLFVVSLFILFSLNIFTENAELFSFLISIFITAIYYSFLSLFFRKSLNNQYIPEIVELNN